MAKTFRDLVVKMPPERRAAAMRAIKEELAKLRQDEKRDATKEDSQSDLGEKDSSDNKAKRT